MNLNLTPATRYGLNILGLIGVTVAFSFGASIFLPVTIAALLAACLWPAAIWMRKRVRLPWFLCCIAVIFFMCLIGTAVFLGLATSVPQLVEDLKPRDSERQIELYQKVRSMTMRLSPFPIDEKTLPSDASKSGVFQQIKEALDGQLITNFLLSTVVAGGRLFWQGILVLFIVFFMMLEGEMLAKKVRSMFGAESETKRKVGRALTDMAESIRTYLVWRTIVNFALALLLGAIYKACGLKQWYLWALLTAILTYVPYLGPIIAGVFPVLDALVFHDNPAIGFGLGFFYLGVVTFEGYVIVPWLMGRKMNLNATTVMAGCLYWDYVWGTAGLFLAMPLLAGLKSICLNVDGWREFGHLMGSEEEVDTPLPGESETTSTTAVENSPSGAVVELQPAENPAEKNGTIHTPAPINQGS
ncbi:MAG: AI-2E family transporter [Gemmataceae bacterium]